MKQWRKIYTGMTVQWAILPWAARALADELLRIVDDDFVLHLEGQDPVKVICLMLCVKPKDRRFVRAGFDALVSANLVHVDDIRIALNAFGARSADIMPTSGRCVDTRSPTSVPDGSSNNRESFNSQNTERENESKKERVDRAREEPSPPEPYPEVPATGVAGDGEDHAESRRMLTQGYQRRYESSTSMPWQSFARAYSDIRDVAAWVDAYAASSGRPAAEIVDQVLDGYWRDDWAREHRWQWGTLARDPARYIPAQIAPADPGDDPRFSHYPPEVREIQRRFMALRREREELFRSGDAEGAAAADRELDRMGFEARRAMAEHERKAACA